jgi:hypothetical protein
MLTISDILATHGPCIGSELLRLVDLKVLSLWRACCLEPDTVMHRVSQRYLRLDRAVEGYARLSPSIRREFLNYTVVGLVGQVDDITARSLELQQDFVRVSQLKRELARDTVQRVVESSPNRERLRAHVCYMIAGDVMYNVADTFERPESSTGRLVRGSDLDLVIVSDNDLCAEERGELDELVYHEKWHMLVLPQFREEIDYVVKDVSKVKAQLRFDSLEHMIASKILQESELLYGSADLFSHIKWLVRQSGVPDRLKQMEDKAIREREAAEMQLVMEPEPKHTQACRHLFFTDAAWEEIG